MGHDMVKVEACLRWRVLRLGLDAIPGSAIDRTRPHPRRRLIAQNLKSTQVQETQEMLKHALHGKV